MCGSLRRPPECSKQGIPAATPHVGQGTASKVSGGMSPIRIRKRYHQTFRKTVRFGTLLKLAFPQKSPVRGVARIQAGGVPGIRMES